MSFRLLSPAVDDLESIDAWIVSNFSERAAAKAQLELFQVFALLAKKQRIGVERPDIASPPVRFFAAPPNWIIYEPGDPLLVHRVFPARMDLDRLDLA